MDVMSHDPVHSYVGPDCDGHCHPHAWNYGRMAGWNAADSSFAGDYHYFDYNDFDYLDENYFDSNYFLSHCADADSMVQLLAVV